MLAEGDQWLTLSGPAKLENVAAPVMSRKVARFEGRGELKTQLDGRKTMLLSFAGRSPGMQIPAKMRRASEDDEEPPDELPLDGKNQLRGRTRRYRKLQADLAQVQLDEMLGRLIQVEKVEAVAQRCIEPILRQWDQIIARADGTIVVSRDGTRGLRLWLKESGESIRSGRLGNFRHWRPITLILNEI